MCTLFYSGNCAWAIDEALVRRNVDSIVAGLESGKDIQNFKAGAYDPYMFIMEEDGVMLVHPSLAGQNLMDKAPPVFVALLEATPDGGWLDYEWQGKMKHTYAKRTKNNLIVGSGY